MASADDKNRIEELKESLYSRTAPDVRTRRKLRLSSVEPQVKTSWDRPPEEPVFPTELNQSYEDHSMSFLTKLLIASFIFCVAAVGIGAYIFYNGANLISGDNIDISISGPVSVPGGAPVSFDIKVTNKNNADLVGADMAVDFPDGSANPVDAATELKTVRELVGDIPAGRSTEKTVSAIMFGEENLQKTIQVTITYKIKGSTSLFTKKTTYDVLINSSPILLTVSSFKEITSGQEFSLKVKLKSNSQDTLKNVLLKGSYPFGFTFVSSDVKPTVDNSTWKIGDIPPDGERTITINGTLQGEDSETRVFKFAAGAQSSVDPKSIGTQYMAVEQHMSIQKPFVSLAISIDNDDGTGDHAASIGRPERVSIGWFNNLTTAVSNMVVTAKLSGTAYDKSSVQPDMGYYDSANDQIVWNRQTNSEFASVPAGQNGSVSFTVTPHEPSSASSNTNPSVVVSASVSGNRAEGSGVPEKLSSIVSRTSKVSSTVSLIGRVLRTAGPFPNTGPIPPKVEQTTTYTVLWTVDNTYNAISGARVSATLPAYVKWLGETSPSGERISYDENSGEIVWDIGSISPHTASSAKKREVYFQISIQPGANQANQSPTIVNQAVLTATDTFTNEKLEVRQDYLTTRFSTDPAYSEGDATVAK